MLEYPDYYLRNCHCFFKHSTDSTERGICIFFTLSLNLKGVCMCVSYKLILTHGSTLGGTPIFSLV